jgi:hypothetical protein
MSVTRGVIVGGYRFIAPVEVIERHAPSSSPPVLRLVWSGRSIPLRDGESPEQMIALLGHELQHALELAAAPEVPDGPECESCFVGLAARHRPGTGSKPGRLKTCSGACGMKSWSPV